MLLLLQEVAFNLEIVLYFKSQQHNESKLNHMRFGKGCRFYMRSFSVQHGSVISSQRCSIWKPEGALMQKVQICPAEVRYNACNPYGLHTIAVAE